MTNMSKLRKITPMPSRCPFCGKPLSKENADVDHILPVALGGTDDPDNLRYICRDCNIRKADKYDHLFEFYYTCYKDMNIECEHIEQKLDAILRTLSEEDLTLLKEKVDPVASRTRRLLTYYGKLGVASDEEKEKLLSAMLKTIKAYSSYDYDSEEKELINGNTFFYKKDFPIEKYRETLSKFGDRETGNSYTAYLDEKERLVVY